MPDFLPRDPDARRRELTRLRGLRMPVVLMDTPYRLGALLDDVAKTFGKGAQVTLACDLTLPKETILPRRGQRSTPDRSTSARPNLF